jgi:hypothetical protein
MWWQGAKCRREATGCSPFFGPDTVTATRICQDCPVKLNCLQSGLKERWGVWGGATSQQRARIRRLVIDGVPLKDAFARVNERKGF